MKALSDFKSTTNNSGTDPTIRPSSSQDDDDDEFGDFGDFNEISDASQNLSPPVMELRDPWIDRAKAVFAQVFGEHGPVGEIESLSDDGLNDDVTTMGDLLVRLVRGLICVLLSIECWDESSLSHH